MQKQSSSQDAHSHPFKGLGIALITPFDSLGTIHLPSLASLVRHVTAPLGADFLVLLGTTGESPTVEDDEREMLFRTIKSAAPQETPIVIGVGDNHTTRLLARLKDPFYAESDGLLSVNPYYNKPNQRGLFLHFSAMARESSKPILLYNIPGRTGVDLLPETVAQLQRAHHNIVAIKEATGTPQRVTELCNVCEPHFTILSGDDHIACEQCRMGASGVISVVGNAYPITMKKLIECTLQGEYREAEYIHKEFALMYRLLFAEGNPTGIKCLLHHMGLITDNVLRLPLCPASTALQEAIIQEHARLSKLGLAQ